MDKHKATALIVLIINISRVNGFDIVDNGSGYTQSELAILCKCLPQRERNEIYKIKSIGFRGEALNSLCKSSRVTITTKHNDEPSSNFENDV